MGETGCDIWGKWGCVEEKKREREPSEGKQSSRVTHGKDQWKEMGGGGGTWGESGVGMGVGIGVGDWGGDWGWGLGWGIGVGEEGAR